MIKVVIPEPIPSLNKGEAAILEGIREMFSLHGGCEITLFSPSAWIRDDSRNYRHLAQVVGGTCLVGGPERSRLLAYRVVSKWLLAAVLSRILGGFAKHVIRDELLRSLCDADVILAAHDGMMGPGQSHIARVGRIMNKPVVFCGSGMGSAAKLSSRKRRQVRYAVNNAACCVVRDKATYGGLQLCQADEKRVYLAPDPAVLLPACDDMRAVEILKSQGVPASARHYLCAVVSAEGGVVARASFAAERSEDAKRRLRVELWRELLSHLMTATNAHVVFLPHCIGPSPRNDDRRMAADICDALARYKDRVTCMVGEYSAGELKGIMRGCQLVLSERAHAAIGAFSAGTPCIGFAPATDARMHSIVGDMFHRPVCNLDAPDMAQFRALVIHEWNERQQTRAAMAEQVGRIIEQTREAAKWMHGRIEDSLRHGSRERLMSG